YSVFFIDPAATEIYTLSLHDALPICELWPAEKVFIDGRLEVIGEDFFQKYLAINGGPGWADMMRRYDPNLALVPHTSIDLLSRRSEEHTSELQSRSDLVCRLLLEKKK